MWDTKRQCSWSKKNYSIQIIWRPGALSILVKSLLSYFFLFRPKFESLKCLRCALKVQKSRHGKSFWITERQKCDFFYSNKQIWIWKRKVNEWKGESLKIFPFFKWWLQKNVNCCFPIRTSENTMKYLLLNVFSSYSGKKWENVVFNQDQCGSTGGDRASHQRWDDPGIMMTIFI